MLNQMKCFIREIIMKLIDEASITNRIREQIGLTGLRWVYKRQMNIQFYQLLFIFFITSDVNFALTAIAPIFSSNCSGLVAPKITELTCGLCKHQAIESWESVQSSASANCWSCLVFSIKRMKLSGKSHASFASRLSLGIP